MIAASVIWLPLLAQVALCSLALALPWVAAHETLAWLVHNSAVAAEAVHALSLTAALLVLTLSTASL